MKFHKNKQASSINRRTDTIEQNKNKGIIVSSREDVLLVLESNSYHVLFADLLPDDLGDSFVKSFCDWLDEYYGLIAVVVRDLKDLFVLSDLQAHSLVFNKLFAVPQVVISSCRKGSDPSSVSRAIAKAALKLCKDDYYKEFKKYIYSDRFVNLKHLFEVFVRKQGKTKEEIR